MLLEAAAALASFSLEEVLAKEVLINSWENKESVKEVEMRSDKRMLEW